MTTPPTRPPNNITEHIDAIVARTRLLPMDSPVAASLELLLHDPDATLDEIAALVARDPTIAARVLRAINSAYFGVPEPVDSLERAIQLVGVAAVSKLIDTTSILRIFAVRLPHNQRMNAVLDGLWRHSVATGVAARLLAPRIGVSDPMPYFAAGLLHDIGKVALLLLKPAEYEVAVRLAATDHIPLALAERHIFDFDHAQLGQHLCAAWGQPEDVCFAVWRHHSIRSSEPQSIASPMAAVVHVADILARALGVGWWGDRVMPRLETAASHALELQANDAEILFDALEVEYPRTLTSLANIFTNAA